MSMEEELEKVFATKAGDAPEAPPSDVAEPSAQASSMESTVDSVEVSVPEPSQAPSDESPETDDDGALRQWAQWLAENPEAIDALSRWYVSRVSETPAETPAASAAVDEDLDPEEARFKALERRIQQLEARLHTEETRKTQEAAEVAWERFLSRHQDLSEEDRVQILRTTHADGLATAALTREKNPIKAFEDAFEKAYRIAFFERTSLEAARRAREMAAEDARRQQAAQVATGGMPSRTPPEPKTPEEFRRAMTEMLREAMQANQ